MPIIYKDDTKPDSQIIDKNDQTGFWKAVMGDAYKRASSIKETFSDTASGKITPVETGIQAVGQTVGFVGDIIGEGIKEGVEALTPESVKKMGLTLLQSRIGQEAIRAISKGVEVYEDWKSQNPRAAKNIESILNIGAIYPVGKVGQAGIQEGKSFLEAGGEVLRTGIQSTGKLGEIAGTKVLEVGKNIIGKKLEPPIKNIVEAIGETDSIIREARALDAQNTIKKYAEQAKRAIQDYSQPTPLALAGDKAKEALDKINLGLKQLGEAKKELTTQLGATKVGTIVEETRTSLRSFLKDRVGINLNKEGEILEAKGRSIAVSDPVDMRMLTEVDNKLMNIGKNATFQRVDDAIDYIQDILYKRAANVAIPVNKKIEGILKETIGELNAKLQKIGGKEYQRLNAKYSEVIKLRDDLNKALGKDANKGAALMKQLFSPAGTGAQKIFNQVKVLTGIDLVKEATLAKYIMEQIGDVRQASLLQAVLTGQMSLSKVGALKHIGERILEKINDPIQNAIDASQKVIDEIRKQK